MRMRLAVIVWLTALLCACGFHLRGNIPFAPPLQSMYVQSTEPYGTLTKYLKQSLKTSHVRLAEQQSEATTMLNITSENTAQDLLSVNGTLQTRQYQLRVIVTFEIDDNKGRVIVPSQTLTESRVITVQSNQILGSSNEADMYFEQMRRTLATTMMYRLTSHEVTKMVNQAFKTEQKPRT